MAYPYLAVLSVWLLAAQSALGFGEDPHAGDFVVGRTSSNQLAVEFDTAEAYELPPVAVIPGDGWGSEEPGYMALDVDEPLEDFFTLALAAEISIELVSVDPALQVLDFPFFAPLLVNPGDQWAMPAGNDFDEHPYWFVDDPDYSEEGQVYAFTFKVVDLSGTYADSANYTAQFTPVPEPHTAVLLMLGGLAICRRRSL
jgi:hypothetical protein